MTRAEEIKASVKKILTRQFPVPDEDEPLEECAPHAKRQNINTPYTVTSDCREAGD